MKYILLFIVIPTLLFSQEWNDSYWEKVPIYKNGQEIDFNDYRVLDAKCYDEECFLVLTNEFLFIEIIKSSDGGETWNSIYDNKFDIFGEDPPDDFILYNPQLAELQSPNEVIITYDDKNGILNKFNLNTFENDTSFKLNTYSDIKNLHTNSNGYGIAAYGIHYYITKDHWKTAEFYKTHSIGEVLVTKNNIFHNSNYNTSDSSALFNMSVNGIDWEQSLIGRGYIQTIYSFNDELFWAGGINLFSDDKKRHDLIYNSIDGGKTWDLQHEDSTFIGWSIRDINFINTEIGIALTPLEVYYTTTNGGEDWIKQQRSYDPKAIAMNKTFLSKKSLFQFVGLSGLYKYNLSLLTITSVPLNEYRTIKTYPSPFVNRFTLDAIDEPSGNYSLKLHSLSGDLVLDRTINIPSQIDIEANLPSGSYFLILENEKNHFFQKIIKE
jgi:hypothetical protein